MDPSHGFSSPSHETVTFLKKDEFEFLNNYALGNAHKTNYYSVHNVSSKRKWWCNSGANSSLKSVEMDPK